MAPLLALLLPALLPVGAGILKDVFGGITRLITGDTGAKPQNVDEYIKMQQADVERMKALAELDKPAANISLWVADLRAAFRYIAAGIIIVSTVVVVATNGLGVTTVPENILELLLDMSGVVFSFIFGQRLYVSLKK